MDNKEFNELEVSNNISSEEFASEVSEQIDNKTQVEESTDIFGLNSEEETTNDKETIREQDPIVKEEVEVSQEVQPSISEKIELNGDEKVVYEYKPKKSFGIWPYLLFFGFIGAIIIFLPDIQKTFNDMKSGKVVSGNKTQQSNNNNSSNNNETPIEDVTYYELNTNSSIPINKLVLSNFDKLSNNNTYYLSFNIFNKDNTMYKYTDNLYIEIYNENKTLLNRLKLEEDIALAGQGNRVINMPISELGYVTGTKIVVKEIAVADYPQVSLQQNLKDQEVLTCVLDNRTLVYTFSNMELISIDETVNVLASNYTDLGEYADALNSYKQKADEFNVINGISSTSVVDNNGLVFKSTIDSKTVDDKIYSTLNEKVYYKGKTQAKVVAFEMQARGYSCK